MLFVDKKTTLRQPRGLRSTPTELILHALPAWSLILFLSGFLTGAGALLLLAIANLVALPLVRRLPYRKANLEGRTLRLLPVRFLGFSVTPEIVVDLDRDNVDWTVIKRRVSIAPRQGAPFVLILNRPGQHPVWLACAASPRYLEREIRDMMAAA